MITPVIKQLHVRPRTLLLGLAVLLVVPTAHAQWLTWEQVGDIPVGVLDIELDDFGALWAIQSEIYRLDFGATSWVEVADESHSHILVIDPDTLLHSGGSVARSTDGGETWEGVWDEGGTFYETALAGPHSGLLLTGVRDSSGSGYSLDRGMTWQRSTFAEPSTSNRECRAFLEMPVGHPFEGRMMAGCLGGLAYSDDGGRVWNYTNAWWTFQTDATSLTLGPDGTAYAVSGDGPGPLGYLVWASSDGVTWEQRAPLVGSAYLVSLPYPAPLGSLIAITRSAEDVPGVYGSTDGGHTFTLLGRIPDDSTAGGSLHANDMLLGPDGLLYVAAGRTGPTDEWVYRTTEPVVVASEPGVPEIPEVSLTLSVRPNPAVGQTQVEFEVTETTTVRMEVFDALGREVAVLADGRYEHGRYTSTFGGSDLASGLYVVRVTVTPETSGLAQTYTERITLLK